MGLLIGPAGRGRIMIFDGPRGIGKTALLRAICAKAEAMGWASLSLPEQAGEGADWADLVESKASGVDFSRSGLLIAMDDITPDRPGTAKALLEFQMMMGDGLPVALIAAGLPNDVVRLRDDDRLSFLRMAYRKQIQHLPDEVSRGILQHTAALGGRTFREEALDMAVKAAEGLPLMLQMIGRRSFANAAGGEIAPEDVGEGIRMAKADLGDVVFSSAMRSLSDMDRRFLIAMAEDRMGSRMTDIAFRTGAALAELDRNRRRLMHLGLIVSDGRGRVATGMPLLREWLNDTYVSKPRRLAD